MLYVECIRWSDRHAATVPYFHCPTPPKENYIHIRIIVYIHANQKVKTIAARPLAKMIPFTMLKVPILQLSISLALGILLAYPLTSHSMARRMLIGEISRDITQMTPEEKWKQCNLRPQ